MLPFGDTLIYRGFILLFYFGSWLKNYWGPARLLQSHAILIGLSLYIGFFITRVLLPKFYTLLPSDRGREFTLSKEVSKGKPTGSGVVFITIFSILALIFTPFDYLQVGIIILTWLMMLTGYLDDRSTNGWGEYIKAFLDLVIAVAASLLMYKYLSDISPDGKLYFWIPFFTHPIYVSPWIFISATVIMLWLSVNTTNCTDGVDGLSSTLVLIGLFALGGLFYFVLGHTDIASYLLIPHFIDGAAWGLMCFTMAGVVMGYLWHNAFPSKCLMGGAGSRALGFFIGVGVMVSGNPFLILATSSIIMVNGGMGLLKVFLLRFFKIKIFENIRFPLHDHFRKNHDWSPTQVLLKFVMLQLLITSALVGIFFKVR